MSAKKIDLLVLILLVALGIIYSQLTQGRFIGRPLLVSLVVAVPTVTYLGLREQKQWRKVWASTASFGLLLGFFFEFIQEFNRSYTVVLRVFPKILGVLPLDNVLGHALMTLLTITFYQHFIRGQEVGQGSGEVSHRVKVFTYAVLALISATLLLFFLAPARLHLDYPYAFFGMLAIVPIFLLAFRKPQLIPNLTLMVPFFFFTYLAIELVAVKDGWWVYPGGNYVGWVTFFGYGFPFEGLFFWMLFYAPALVSYYELWVEINP